MNVPHLDGHPVRRSADVPLTRRAKDGTERPALCWQRDGAILVHPERWAAFVEAFGEELA